MKRFLVLICLATTFFAHAQNVGIGTVTPDASALLHVDLGASTSKGLLINGTVNVNSTVPNLGTGSRMMFYPGKAAFRAGYAAGAGWDNTNVGYSSTALGNGTIASGSYSTALGSSTIASGPYSTAIGALTNASAFYSIAIGYGTFASGFYSTSMGFSTNAVGANSIAIGNTTTTYGSSSTAMGFGTIASGDFSTAMGYNGFANSNYSVAIGENVTANSFISTSLGRHNDPIVTSPTTTWALTEPLLIVGNGTGAADKKNAFAIAKNGNIYIDPSNKNDGSQTGNMLLFGTFGGTSEGISSTRTATGNQYGLDFYTGGNSRISITNSGNVGIGTAIPVAKLHVSAGDASLALFGPNATYGAKLYIGSTLTNQSNASTAQVFVSDGNLHIDPALGHNIYIGYYQARDIYLDPNGGNVGIGTTNPQKNLSIQNGMNVDQADANTGSVINAFTFGSNSGEGIGSKRNAGSNQWGLDFYTNSTNKMSITNGGNVGIGTATPATKLEVNGYTKLGSNAPSIKILKLTGTTAATDGGYVDIPNGLDPSKILSVSVIVQYAGSVFIGDGDEIFSGSKFYWAVWGSNIRIFNYLGGSASILSKPAKILITYEE